MRYKIEEGTRFNLNHQLGNCVSIHLLFLCVEPENTLEMLMTRNVWSFSISLDMSTRQGVSYLHIQIRLCWKGYILNLHLVSITVFDRRTGENMFNVSGKFFDCICQDCQQIILGIATDGDRSRTGCIQSLATRFEQGAIPGLI